MTKKKYPMVLNWKNILLYLFENKPQITFSRETNKEKHRIGDYIYDDSELHRFISYFKNLGYFEHEKVFSGKVVENIYTITKEGVSVALDLQKHKDMNLFNAGLLLLTFILAWSPLISFSDFVCNKLGIENGYLPIIVFFIMLFAVIFYFKKLDKLN